MDTCGLLPVVLVTGAGVQDRDGARMLLWALATCFRRVRMVWVDGAYSGGPVTLGTDLGLVVEVVAKLAGQVGFKALPRSWVVERTFPGSTAAGGPSVTTSDGPNVTQLWSSGPWSSS
jgi:putative transposase